MIILGMHIIFLYYNNPEYFVLLSVYFGCSGQASLQNFFSLLVEFKCQNLVEYGNILNANNLFFRRTRIISTLKENIVLKNWFRPSEVK